MVNLRLGGRVASVSLIAVLAALTALVATARPLLISVDTHVESALAAIRTPILLRLFDWITLFGSPLVVVGVAGIVLLFLFTRQFRKSYETGFASALIGAAVSAYWMKALVERARPSGLIPTFVEPSFSFPSGHATIAVVLYGFIAFVLCELHPKMKPAIVTAAAIFILAIGFSRLYLGVHFPSDVIAGYSLGGLWLLLGIEIAERFRTRL